MVQNAWYGCLYYLMLVTLRIDISLFVLRTVTRMKIPNMTYEMY
jgi:hypothetical protein